MRRSARDAGHDGLVIFHTCAATAEATRQARQSIRRLKRERNAVLQSAVQLTFADEAKSLQRAAVPHERARILAVDDEHVILDSFRKILVLAGFSVDTVDNGPEALSLLRGLQPLGS